MWVQRQIKLGARSRGFHLIGDELEAHLPELAQFSVGVAHFFIQHSSASLTINENADPSVRGDMERYINRAVPEDAPYYQHIYEGSDDMPAHIKASLFGNSVSVPICGARLALGTWQGIYLGEHRDHGGQRRIIATLQGE